MKVYVYPADNYGCGHHRMIWPAEALRAAGHDVHIILPKDRALNVHMQNNQVVHVETPEDMDVMVLQRVTHPGMAGLVRNVTSRNIAVVIDIDDDLGAIHPLNPAAAIMNLKYDGVGRPNRTDDVSRVHSWRHLETACGLATMVTVTTPQLAQIYGKSTPARVLPNYLSSQYFDDTIHRVDNEMLVWPASIHSHPNDPQVMGTAMRDLVAEGADFRVISEQQDVAAAFSLSRNPGFLPSATLAEWPRAISHAGIGIVPLANTKFNRSKSWLKGLELSAVGVPWVASPRTEYRKLCEQGAGWLAAKPGEWLRLLRLLRNNASLRQEMSEAGRATAKLMRLEDHAWKWLEAWDDALSYARR